MCTKHDVKAVGTLTGKQLPQWLRLLPRDHLLEKAARIMPHLLRHCGDQGDRQSHRVCTPHAPHAAA